MGGALARACESGKETALTVLAWPIASAIACGAFLSYQLYCKCPKFCPNIGRARNWPSRQPAVLYECSFEQWARILVGSWPDRPDLFRRACYGTSCIVRLQCISHFLSVEYARALLKCHVDLGAEFGQEFCKFCSFHASDVHNVMLRFVISFPWVIAHRSAYWCPELTRDISGV